VTDAKVKLGRILYYDPACRPTRRFLQYLHPLDAWSRIHPRIHRPQEPKGSRNAPTVYNAAGHFAQFWDGRAPSVEEQAKGPITNPVEMAMPSSSAAVEVIKSMPEYIALFQTAFPKTRSGDSTTWRWRSEHSSAAWSLRRVGMPSSRATSQP
jgi:cytochrome c peroxidase